MLYTGECNMPYKVKLDLAYIGHFRTTCVDNCDQPTVEVPQLLAHQDQVMRHVDQVIQTLNLLSWHWIKLEINVKINK